MKITGFDRVWYNLVDDPPVDGQEIAIIMRMDGVAGGFVIGGPWTYSALSKSLVATFDNVNAEKNMWWIPCPKFGESK
jgi:hypothetical protein